MEELSDFIRDGQKFLFDELGLSERELKLMGKISWLRVNEKVHSVEYDPSFGSIDIRFKERLSVKNFEKLLGVYGLPRDNYSRHKGKSERVTLKIWEEPSDLEIYFSPVEN